MIEAKRKRRFILVVCCAFVSLLALNMLTPMETDDYSYMFSYETGERFTSFSQLVPSIRAFTNAINGRIVTSAVLSQLLANMGKPVFNVLNSLMYVAFLLGLYLLAKAERHYDWKLLLGLHGGVFLFAPAFGASVLWLAGACNYLWGTTLILLAILPFRNTMLVDDYSPGKGKQALFVMTALLAGNVTENTSFAMMALMALCMLIMIIQNKKIPLWMALATMAALVGYIVLFMSPATRGRVGGGLGRYLQSFTACMNKLLEHKWLLIAYSILFWMALKWQASKARLYFSLVLFICAMVSNVMMTASDYYPGRSAFGWIVFILIACGILVPSLEVMRGFPLWNIVLTCLTMLTVITFLYAVPQCYNRYRQAEARIADVVAQRDAGGMDAVTFGISSKTKYDPYCDGNGFSADAAYLPNRMFAKYYGLDSVSLSEEVN